MYGKPYRGFESLSLRQILQGSFANYAQDFGCGRPLRKKSAPLTPAKRLNLKTDVRENRTGGSNPSPRFESEFLFESFKTRSAFRIEPKKEQSCE
jgi:hypothetical protein